MKVIFNKRKRSDLDIILDILSSLQNGSVPKTRLLYKANLTYVTAEKYISILLTKDIIKKQSNSFYITDKGKKILEILNKYRDKMNEINELLELLKKELYNDKDGSHKR
ncbi:MAG: winged helix-turn-helix domain-containing protein [Metallosphaera sp.]